MTDMNEPDHDTAPATPRRVQRRSREEIETLVKGGDEVPQRSRSTPLISLAVIGVVLLAGLLWLLSPRREQAAERPASAPGEAALMQQRIDAQIERARKQRSGSDYFERTAAAEAALLQDLSKNAGRLAKVAEAAAAAPPSASARQAGAPAAASSAASKSEPKPGVKSESPPPEPARNTAAPGESAPVEMAKATSAAPTPAAAPAPEQPGAQCRIHVSELSSSGKLTYADIARMKGARVDEKTGHAFTPPIPVNGMTMVFDVAPNGCVTVARALLGR